MPKVRHHGRAQAQRLEGGNASDRWARALYLQLAASAEARLDNAAAAAELLAKARGIRDMEPAQVDRWQYQEARLRLKANQTQQARDLLSNWLERHAGSATDRWLMAQLLSEDGQWSAAASWVAAALELETTPDEQHSVFAATVLQRAGDKGGAFAIIRQALETGRQRCHRVAASGRSGPAAGRYWACRSDLGGGLAARRVGWQR